jgi:peroxiredoxin Q/BCP
MFPLKQPERKRIIAHDTLSSPMSKPLPGTTAPDFTAPVAGGGYPDGAAVTLSALRGRPVVLYFYPKDDTPGCNTQACALRDAWANFQERAHVFGVSVDSLKSHAKFITKHALPFPILSDETQTIVSAYGVWVEKNMYGKKYMGTERSTFVIGVDGVIKTVLEKVKPAEHAAAVLAALGTA